MAFRALLKRAFAEGNYAYACARVKAKKAKLFDKPTIQRMVLMDIVEINRFIGESVYRKEMDELSAKYSGIDLLEYATSMNLARTYRSILGYTSGELRDMVQHYLQRWDVWNIKTIIRGKVYGATYDEVVEDLVPAGRYGMDELVPMIHAPAIDEVIAELKGTEYYQPLLIAFMEDPANLALMEDALDKTYYSFLLSSIPSTNRPNKLLLLFVRKEIDIMNLKTLLRLKHEEVSGEKIITYTIPGGYEFAENDLRKLATSENFDESLNELKEYRLYDAVKETIDTIAKHHTLNYVLGALEKHLILSAEKFARLYPLSVLPILDYILRKENEVDNIRIIARGKERGLDEGAIKSMILV